MDSNNNFDSFLIKKFLKEETEFLEEQKVKNVVIKLFM